MANQSSTSPAQTTSGVAKVGLGGKLGWSFFDFANSAFTTVIITFVFAAYFQQGVAPTEEVGTRWWGWSLAISGLVIAVLSPILGAIADHTGRRKLWIAFFTALCVVCSFALFWIEPKSVTGGSTQMMIAAILLVAVANVGFELGQVFINAMLPDLTEDNNIGRWSGFAWGLGYIGGLLCLLMCLVLFINPEQPAFGLDKESAEHVRATAPFIAIWFVVFSLPMFFLSPDRPRGSLSYSQAIKQGLTSLVDTISHVRRQPVLFKFLIAHLFYRDGLNTLLQMGGLFAAAVFGLTTKELIQFAMLLNVTAALGAFVFGWLDDKYGSRNVLIISLVCLTAFSIALLIAQDKMTFYIVAAALGLFVGSIQSSSRTMIGRLADDDKVTETYGLFAFSGKSSAFVGPLLVGELTVLFGHRVGMSSLLVFVVIGLVLLFWVRSDKA